jgi:hypothetical protein
MGAFASMAQNSYGLKIMGGVAFVFGLFFIAEFISLLRVKEKKELLTIAEPACLAIISFIFGLRVFYIHFNYVELLFGAAAVLLTLVYLRKMLVRYRLFQSKNKTLAILVLIFHLSIILFLISLALVPFAAKTAEYSGIASFIFLVFFLVAGIFRKDLLVEGEKVSAFVLVRKFKDHSIIIVSLIIMFSFYVGFNKIGILPGIYSDEFPRAYFKLVDNAATGKEKVVEGKYKHELFMEKYDEFMKRNSK